MFKPDQQPKNKTAFSKIKTALALTGAITAGAVLQHADNPKKYFSGKDKSGIIAIDKAQQSRELAEIKKIVATDTGVFKIISPQELDSSNSDTWRNFLDREKLLQAWLPPVGSPYLRFAKTKTINSVEFVGKKIQPRYSGGEIQSEQGIDNLIRSGELKKGTAVILDSGGAHSVAMAVKLVGQGFQPVVMFDSIPHSKGTNRPEQELATLLYFAEQMSKLKREGKIKPNAPPVFILDTHRADKDYSQHKTGVENTYAFDESDFPSAEEWKKLGISRIIYLNEGDQAGQVRPDFQSPDRLGSDLKSIAEKWTKRGLKIIYTGVMPWEEFKSRPKVYKNPRRRY